MITLTPASLRTAVLAGIASALLAACATPPPDGPLRPETMVAITDQMELIKFNAGRPHQVLERKPVSGLAAGESLMGVVIALLTTLGSVAYLISWFSIGTNVLT